MFPRCGAAVRFAEPGLSAAACGIARPCAGLGSWELEEGAVQTLLSVAGDRLPLLAKAHCGAARSRSEPLRHCGDTA